MIRIEVIKMLSSKLFTFGRLLDLTQKIHYFKEFNSIFRLNDTDATVTMTDLSDTCIFDFPLIKSHSTNSNSTCSSRSSNTSAENRAAYSPKLNPAVYCGIKPLSFNMRSIIALTVKTPGCV